MKLIPAILIPLLIPFVSMGSVPIEKEVPIEHIYTPLGLDTNDRSEVVITGILPNTCHKSPTTNVTRNGFNIDIELTALYYHSTNPYCPPMKIPFTQTVGLGVLDKGLYNITVNGKETSQKTGQLLVVESESDAIDNYVYANVEYIEKVDEGKVLLRGFNPSDCFELDTIKSISNKKDTYSVLPIMKQVQGLCPMKMVPFEYEYTVPKVIDREKVLLHVRVMNGNSVNKIFE